MKEEIEVKKCTKLEDVLVDAKVEASFEDNWEVGYYRRKQWQEDGPVEDVAKALESAVREFEDFLRDHRSQDMIQLEVIREIKDLCSSCKEAWEPYKDEDDGLTYCACCGAMVTEESNRMTPTNDGRER